MKIPDLIFHLVSKRKWKEWQQNGYFRPQVIADDEEWIECYTAANVEEMANLNFRNRKHILMLVINTKRLTSSVELREKEGNQYPMVEKRVNLDAVIDKISLVPDENGLYEIKIEVR